MTTIDQKIHFRNVIKANQFPESCDRMLILYDDAIEAGLGYTSKLIANALLLAIKEKRVLIMKEHPTRRWCSKFPFNLNCFYEPYTHCKPPNKTLSQWSKRHINIKNVRITTLQIHRSSFWYGAHPSKAIYEATYELLFRPRFWVREIGKCIMKESNIENNKFIVVHARFSVDKKRERGSKLPFLTEYLKPIKQLTNRTGIGNIFLQTSTPIAINLFQEWSLKYEWNLSFTKNKRSSRDLWMHSHKNHTYDPSGEQLSVIAQSVNAYIASFATYFLSPSSSMWTWFVGALIKNSRTISSNKLVLFADL